MKKSVLVVGGLLVVLLLAGLATAREEERKGKESKPAKGITPTSALLVGLWAPSGNLPDGATMNIEFTRDRKLKVFGQSMVKGEVKKFNMEGTYKIVEGGLTLTDRGPKGEERAQTLHVIWLSDTEMVTRNAEDAFRLFKKK
jgi:uncharacterized protein (TIGR03066 family)